MDDKAKLLDGIPELKRLRAREPFLWRNSELLPAARALKDLELGVADIEDADARLRRFAPALARLFPETRARGGVIESELYSIQGMRPLITDRYGIEPRGTLLLKADHALPVAGSVKARGGIYEVLCLAEKLALEHRILKIDEPYTALLSIKARELFGRYTVSVGSTGNLGLSIGVTAAALGFKATVHMSAESRLWKRELLASKGVTIVMYEGDYSSAVQAGREAAQGDPFAYFVDDENSRLLFLGYSVAALRLKEQLAAMRVDVDEAHPLLVYIPCGVGGAPGGISFGLKSIFGDAAHCFLCEPVEAPCVMLGMLAGFDRELSIYDIGLTLRTQADGLAVSKASRFVGNTIRHLVSGCITVHDEDLFRFVHLLDRGTGMRIEPSAAAGFMGMVMLYSDPEGGKYRKTHSLDDRGDKAHHLIWTTGGSLVPPQEWERYRARGEELCRS